MVSHGYETTIEVTTKKRSVQQEVIEQPCNVARKRRRIKTEEKAKVVAAVLGEEFSIQFLAAQAFLQ